jgi:hypothetical protein
LDAWSYSSLGDFLIIDLGFHPVFYLLLLLLQIMSPSLILLPISFGSFLFDNFVTLYTSVREKIISEINEIKDSLEMCE